MENHDKDGSAAANAAGLTDGRAGKLVNDNPYERDSNNSNRWLDGWYDAQVELRRVKRLKP